MEKIKIMLFDQNNFIIQNLANEAEGKRIWIFRDKKDADSLCVLDSETVISLKSIFLKVDINEFVDDLNSDLEDMGNLSSDRTSEEMR